MTKKRSSEIFSTKAAFLGKSWIFSRKSWIFSRKSSIFPQNLYKFDLGFSGFFSVARLGFSRFLEWQHWHAVINRWRADDQFTFFNFKALFLNKPCRIHT